jgi:hypothetical protein
MEQHWKNWLEHCLGQSDGTPTNVQRAASLESAVIAVSLVRDTSDKDGACITVLDPIVSLYRPIRAC